jgi:pimeloyl-ACP methyl ester carboxylesterase
MRVLHDAFRDDGPAPALMVLMPGALQQPEEFLAAGFAEAVRALALPLDLVFVDTGMRYLSDSIDGTVLHRLHEDVIGPALDKQYREIWLGGASIGGLMAIACADRHPQLAAGLCLLAPYPGSRIVMAEIDAAGGLERWCAEPHADDGEYRLWQWLAARRGQERPLVHLGHGRGDRFADGLARMAQALGQDADVIDGGHDWATWRALWDRFLARHTGHFMRLAGGEQH